ncbi:MAG: LSM domain-containing protein [Candidatus Omnitrophota bacterium]
MKKIVLFLIAGLIVFSSYALAEDNESVELTVYNQNFGLVKDQRLLDFKKGVNDIRFTDVAALIEPTSVHFKSLTDPKGCLIEEQNYEYDLVNASKLLAKYIDKKIKVVTKDDKIYEGVLMSFDDENIVIAEDKNLSMVCRQDNVRDISFPELPEGLITKPTLMWQISNDKAGRQLTEVSYLTQGINWNADYVVVVDKDDKKIDLSGWVTIDNKSGVTYKDAKLKLIAGDVHRAEKKRYRMPQENKVYAMKESLVQGFEEKAFFEYHMYTLGRPTTVKNNQTKQISLLNANNVPVKKMFIFDQQDYYGLRWYYYDESNETQQQKIKVKIELTNSKENNLGMPLPKGNIKVYKEDSDGSLQFIGEDSIDHTPKDEKIRLYLGDAFDIVGEHKRTNFKTGDHWAEESFEISLRNHKEENIEVDVVEHMWRYANWKIINNSHKFTKKDAMSIEFKVPVQKDGETKINYTVKYWW